MRNLFRHSLSLMASHILHLPRNLTVRLIDAYQQTLSPDHGAFKYLHPYGFCRHSPTCSQYAKETIRKRGVTIGIPLALWRVLRCNPFTTLTDQRVAELSGVSAESANKI